MLKPIALAAAVLCLLAGSALAQGKPTKPEDCAKLEGAKRSECARAIGQEKENLRTNKSGETRAGERAGAVQELNAAKDRPAGGKAKVEETGKAKGKGKGS
jgi:hypothetical protein